MVAATLWNIGRIRSLTAGMTISTHTRGALSRARTSIAALLACATVGLTAVDVQAAQPNPPRLYKVTADLDGRTAPVNRPDAIGPVDFLHKGEKVPVECQKYGDRAYGSRLWDLVSIRDRTLFVPDRFIKTGTNGRAPQIRKCDRQDRVDESPRPGPF
jgi:hypothetical protein